MSIASLFNSSDIISYQKSSRIHGQSFLPIFSLPSIYAIGLGPGDAGYLAPKAKEALRQSDVVVGYTGYMALIAELVQGKEVIATGMQGETERCEAAIGKALQGLQVCVVSSGDAGIYGMASLLYELAEEHPDVEIEVIPGITAAVSAAAILGAPLTNDFSVISLSDLLTPWAVIEKRLDACAAADMVLCLYNPQSKKRRGYLGKACDIALRHKPADTPCGYVRNAFRGSDGEGDDGKGGDGEARDGKARVCILAELREADVDMFTTVIIGNAGTRVINCKLVTVRGYKR